MERDRLQLGYAEADITPMTPKKLVGFYREDSLSKGVAAPLTVQAAVWKSDDICCLITIDNIGFAKKPSDLLRERVGNLLGVSAEKVMLCFSHTHAAPDADEDRGYFEEISRKTTVCVSLAAENMRLVSAGWDNGEAKIGVNRRRVSKDTDDRVGILKLCDAGTGRPELLILRVTAHGNALKRDNYMISPDYFGCIRKAVAQRFRCPVMVVQGAAGNIAPRYFRSEETPADARSEQCVRSSTALEDMAKLVAESVGAKFDSIRQNRGLTAQMYSRHIDLISDVPSEDEALRVAKEAEEMCGIKDSGWPEKVAELHKAEVHEQREDVEMQFFSVGDWCMCGGPYEFMVGFALEAKRILHDEFFYLNGYTNGCLLYFPTEEEFDAGGYEVCWSMLIYYRYLNRVWPFRRDEASRLVRFVTECRRRGCDSDGR